MSDRLKRILLIAGFVIVVVALTYALYLVFFKPPSPAPAQPTPLSPPAGQLPGAGKTGPAPQPGQAASGPAGLSAVAGRPQIIPSVPTPVSRTTVLNDSASQDLSLSPTAPGVRAFNPKDGKFYRIADDGTAVPLSNQQFFGVDAVTWGKQSDKAVISYPDGNKILYDFAADKQISTLPQHWADFAFSPQDDKIAAKSIGNNDSNHFLVTANPDGTGAKAVEDLGNNQDLVHVSWSPNNQMIAYSFTGDPLGYDRQNVVLLGQNHENFKNLVVEGRGFVPNWSPSGNNLLYSVYTSQNGYLPTLWVSGASGNTINANRQNLQINTWANKCAWQNETVLICAVPEALDTGAGLQPDIANNTPDQIYKIDLKSGEKINLGQPDGAPNVSQITISPDGRAAYFTDRISGKLMRFAL